jgi:hypothetical protein
MGDSGWDAGLFCQAEHKSAEVMNVAMHHVVRLSFLEEAPEICCVVPWTRRPQARDYVGSEFANLLVVDAGGIRMNEEIHVNCIAVRMP